VTLAFTWSLLKLNNVKEAMDTIEAELLSDPDYTHSWLCNISVAMQDAGCSREVANDGAERFMFTAFGSRMTFADYDTEQKKRL